ncbi:MAG: hypothetical protein DWQ01_16130 [Planctomycetota bacterium]|nr:MAG: hypothetical protein DWQ01_16130 [Planctomycetota bacterium]
MNSISILMYLATFCPQSTEILTPGITGTGQSGVIGYYWGVSGSGRYVAFSVQHGDDLIPGDTNGKEDVFLVDTETGLIDLVSRTPTGGFSDGDSFSASLSADGQWIAFSSVATNIVPGVNRQQVFVYDRFSQEVQVEGRNSRGELSDGPCSGPLISPDGRYLAFQSTAGNLHPQVPSGSRQIYLRDLKTGQTRLVSEPIDGDYAHSAHSMIPYGISWGGNVVCFQSDASNLVAGDVQGFDDIFVRDLAAGVTERITVDSFGIAANGDCRGRPGAMSWDGCFVVFSSHANNLVLNDQDVNEDIFLRDIQTGITVRISAGPSGLGVNHSSETPSISGRGDFVTFESQASDLVPFDFNNQPDSFLWNRHTGNIERISLSSTHQEINYGGGISMVAASGELVVFQSWGNNVVSGISGSQLYLRSLGNPDFDGDGLPDHLETVLGLGIDDLDSDEDALDDFEEYAWLNSDPNQLDSDFDGLQDGTEAGKSNGIPDQPGLGIWGTDLAVFTPDLDPFTQTDFLDLDTDDDGLRDGEEDRNFDGHQDLLETAAELFDSDGDELGDGLELGRTSGTAHTDLDFFVPDLDPNSVTDPLKLDSDGGGISDGIEDFNKDGGFQLGESDPNNLLDDFFDLFIPNLIPGQTATVQISGAKPGAWVSLGLSLTGNGPTQFQGFPLSLSLPVYSSEPMFVNPAGSASLNLEIPGSAGSGKLTHWQAVEIFDSIKLRLSDPVTVSVQ